jgi:hypothetical protein
MCLSGQLLELRVGDRELEPEMIGRARHRVLAIAVRLVRVAADDGRETIVDECCRERVELLADGILAGERAVQRGAGSSRTARFSMSRVATMSLDVSSGSRSHGPRRRPDVVELVVAYRPRACFGGNWVSSDER